MALSDFLATLTNTTANVTVIDSTDVELIKFVASGSAQILATTLAKTIDEITIVNAQNITIKLNA